MSNLSTHLFTYPDYGSTSSYTEHIAHSGQQCTIVREMGDDERDEEVGPMYVTRFADGVELTVLYDELTPRPATATLTDTPEGWRSRSLGGVPDPWDEWGMA